MVINGIKLSARIGARTPSKGLNGIISVLGTIVEEAISHKCHLVTEDSNRIDIGNGDKSHVLLDHLGGLINGHITIIDGHIGYAVGKRDVIDGLASIIL